MKWNNESLSLCVLFVLCLVTQNKGQASIAICMQGELKRKKKCFSVCCSHGKLKIQMKQII